MKNEFVVDQRGSGDFLTISEAIEAVPYNAAERIIVKNGIYSERISSDKKNLTIEGEGEVLISGGLYAKEKLSDGEKRGTFRTSTAFFSGEYLELKNLTFANTSGSGREYGQAIALYLDVDEARLENVKATGHQDTVFLAPLPEKEREKGGFRGPRCYSERKLNKVFWCGGLIEGSVDFIFGGADAYFHNVLIRSNEEGFVAAPSGYRKDIGFLFDSCAFECTSALPDESVYLMRPWRKEGKATFINCVLGNHINHDGFHAWPGLEDEAEEASFSVFNSKGVKETITSGEAEAIIKRFQAESSFLL